MKQTSVESNSGPIVAGDTVTEKPQNPFTLTLSNGFSAWMEKRRISLAFTTYTVGKIVLIGPGVGGRFVVNERNFGNAMAMRPTPSGFYLSTQYAVWRFENGLTPGQSLNGWDRIYMPRSCNVTGNVDIHDLHVDRQGRLLAAVTKYNCLAELDQRGSFSPIWRPSFIDQIVNQDRCHFNGFCLEDGDAAYASIVGPGNIKDGWRDHRADGGQIVDIRTNQIVADGLSMPHTPRLYQDELYLLEAGSGWFGRVDRTSGQFERLVWCPGFLRGLTFYEGHAIVALSKPRNKVFSGLPLDSELCARNQQAECAIYIISLADNKVKHKISIVGSVEELYDVAILPGTTHPMLVGLEGEEISKYVTLGPDSS